MKILNKIILSATILFFVFPISTFAMETLDERYNVGIDKVWKIILSDSVDLSSAEESISVEGKNGMVDIDIIVKDDIIEIKPVINYDKNEIYTLVVKDSLKNLDGNSIKDGIVLVFKTGDDVMINSLDYTYKTEYGNLVRVDRDGPILLRDINNIEDYGYSMRLGFNKFNITIGDNKYAVLNEYGDPLNYIEKNNIRYSLSENEEYGIYEIGDKYVTFFYDTTRNDEIRSIYWISKELENKSRHFYNMKLSNFSHLLEQEKLMLEIINETRRVEGLNELKYNYLASEVSRKHSEDMALNDYFDHISIDNKAPSDRFKENRISYEILSENLAFGQRNTIFAHENLMNSISHRENILSKNMNYAGIGIWMNKDENVPYFTINFYR